MINKLNTLLKALFLFDEPVEFQRIMLAGGADVISDNVVMGDLVALLSMIQEIADILDGFAVMVDQGVVDSDDALRAVAGIRAFLKPGQTFAVEGLFFPVACVIQRSDRLIVAPANSRLMAGHFFVSDISGQYSAK